MRREEFDTWYNRVELCVPPSDQAREADGIDSSEE